MAVNSAHSCQNQQRGNNTTAQQDISCYILYISCHWEKDRQSPGILTDDLAKLTMALVKKLPPALSIFGYYGVS